MEETHRASYGEGHGSSTCSATWKLLELTILGFHGGFITEAWSIKSLASDWVNLQPLSSSWKSGGGGTESYNPLIIWLVPLATSPHWLGAFQNSPHKHKPSCGRRSLLWITRHPFHFYSSELIPSTEDKRPNIITKSPTTLIAQEIPRVLGS